MRNGLLQFEVARRSGRDKYRIDLQDMAQKNANNKRGGRVRNLRQVQLRVILSDDDWFDTLNEDGANTMHWQVCLDNGWEMMADNLTSELSAFLEQHGGAAGVVTMTHRWTNPWGKSKETQYTFDLDQMTQRNHDSDRTRAIRLVSMQILAQ